MSNFRRTVTISAFMYALGGETFAEHRTLDDRLHHLRSHEPREWSDFPEAAEGTHLQLTFTAEANEGRQTLRLRQQDVKQIWNVLLNGTPLSQLQRDENDMVVYFEIGPGRLRDGENLLRVEQDSSGKGAADDIRVGQIVLESRPKESVLSEATVEVDVKDSETHEHIPSRITVLDRDGALQTVGAVSNDHVAVRPGTFYTSTGKGTFGLPAGRYTLYAGRGFEYSLDRATIDLSSGKTARMTMSIRREVPTAGYIACDTHVHTLTHSGHGDATVEERMITIAAEGIELAIATDHNVHIDHEPFARSLNVRQYFTPVVGNEVTTGVGHFNIFPVSAGATIPDFRLTDWKSIFASIYGTPGVKVAILNHARDLHGGTRPFGPKLHNAVVGSNLEEWQLEANAMEVVNSAATQTDVMQLFHDWMGMLNGGRMITPVGSSDSHDVGRHFIGQGRTYIRGDDSDPGSIDVEAAVDNFVQGRVLVSYGLLTELTVDGKFGPGELASVPGAEVEAAVRVLGPHWVSASRVELYANGVKIREEPITAAEDGSTGVKQTVSWRVPRPQHDVHLVALAVGPGVDGLYWKTAKSYQPTSPDWKSHVIGCSGAVWLDVDGDGSRTPAINYARRLFAACDGQLPRLLEGLTRYDEAIAAQVAHLYSQSGESLLARDVLMQLETATPATRTGFKRYLDAWRENQMSRGR